MANINNEITKSGTLEGFAENLATGLAQSALAPFSPFNNFAPYLSGSRAIIKINDNLFGFAFRVTLNISTDAQEITTIDDYLPYELAPGRISVSGTLGMFHVPGSSPSGKLVQANVLSFLFHKYVSIEISDQTTGERIFQTNRAVITARKQNINAGDLSTIDLEWKAIGWIDDITPEYPQGYDGNESALDDLEDFFNAL